MFEIFLLGFFFANLGVARKIRKTKPSPLSASQSEEYHRALKRQQFAKIISWFCFSGDFLSLGLHLRAFWGFVLIFFAFLSKSKICFVGFPGRFVLPRAPNADTKKAFRNTYRRSEGRRDALGIEPTKTLRRQELNLQKP